MNDQLDAANPNGHANQKSVQPIRSGRKHGSKSSNRTKPNRHKLIASEDLPRKTLEDALKVPRAIKENYGNGATWEQIASAMGFSPANPNNQYFLWAATAYGIVAKDEQNNYKVTEIGRKILFPTFDGEDREGIIKAIATPSILARFLAITIPPCYHREKYLRTCWSNDTEFRRNGLMKQST